ncbi:MAG TPA: pyridoxamine 5'-phosphate oxidase family protein [Candidatus Dormibacteraeota bacterium]|nr:pyridoxamine 5'-phosphate oxidase family protein [Candidatus Dormibacteraeota bacterium]
MGKLYDGIDDQLGHFMSEQPVFFVGTAPLDAEGHINLSPKGNNRVEVLDERTVAYLDLTGSAVETIAHLRENGRIVVMFCAFQGPPRIVRLHGRGEVVEKGAVGYADLAARFPEHPSARAVIKVTVDRISDSCGYGVPLMTLDRERSQMDNWAAHKGSDGIAEYQSTRNAVSIDGLPGLRPGR